MRLSVARRVAAVPLLAGLLALGMPAAPSSAAALLTWTGTVTRAVDGDTAYIDIDGDGKPALLVRNAGIQAVETGQCHATQALARHGQLVNGKRVRLLAERASSASLGRPLRFVEVANGSGGYTDVQLTLVREGHAMWLNNVSSQNEDSRTNAYHLAAAQAAAAGVGLYDTDFCGSGPSQTAPLKLWVSYDADGSDTANVNGEYIRILNTGSTAVPVAGWWVRDASFDTRFTFPAGATVQAGDWLTVRVGIGTNTARTFHLNHTAPMFPNVSSLSPSTAYGDAAYLFDPQGDLRAHSSYKCPYRCTEPALGHARISSVLFDAPGDDGVNYRAEYIAIQTDVPVDLSWRTVEVNGHTRELGVGSTLNPGETLRIHSGTGPSTRLVRYWGKEGALLANAGGTAFLRTTRGTVISSRSW
jgi:endonuclease YncB( thermonuclease family)